MAGERESGCPPIYEESNKRERVSVQWAMVKMVKGKSYNEGKERNSVQRKSESEMRKKVSREKDKKFFKGDDLSAA